jgi:hypothetical protein
MFGRETLCSLHSEVVFEKRDGFFFFAQQSVCYSDIKYGSVHHTKLINCCKKISTMLVNYLEILGLGAVLILCLYHLCLNL